MPRYPKLSAEGILSLNPDVIVELVPDAAARKTPPERLRAEWSQLPGLHAVRKVRIEILTGDFLTIPGPRLLQTFAALGRALYPEMQWE